MKTQAKKNSLTFKKGTISELNDELMISVFGGDITNPKTSVPTERPTTMLQAN